MITAELKDWFYSERRNVYFGHVFNDVKCRFKDGSRIYTSCVVREDRANVDVIIVHTLNSIYLLRLENKLEEGDGDPWERLGPRHL
jgi:hypothetical protein